MSLSKRGGGKKGALVTEGYWYEETRGEKVQQFYLYTPGEKKKKGGKGCPAFAFLLLGVKEGGRGIL